MAGTFVFIHGTGEQHHAARRAEIRAQLDAHPRFAGFDYVGVPWDELAPKVIDVASALPERYSVEGAASVPADRAIEEFANEFYRDAAATRQQGFVQDVALRILTDAIEKYRLPLTNLTADLLRNVIFYLRHGAAVREFTWRHVQKADQRGPVVIVGHSIGGVIAVDLLSGEPNPPSRVDLLVTVGSQAPLLYLMDALESLRTDDRSRPPFDPWLNVFNPRDPLAFRAGEVFAWSPTPPVDTVLDEPRNLPESHSGYFSEPRLYDAIARQLST